MIELNSRQTVIVERSNSLLEREHLSKRDPSEVAMAELVRMAERAGVLAAEPHDSAGL